MLWLGEVTAQTSWSSCAVYGVLCTGETTQDTQSAVFCTFMEKKWNIHSYIQCQVFRLVDRNAGCVGLFTGCMYNVSVAVRNNNKNQRKRSWARGKHTHPTNMQSPKHALSQQFAFLWFSLSTSMLPNLLADIHYDCFRFAFWTVLCADKNMFFLHQTNAFTCEWTGALFASHSSIYVDGSTSFEANTALYGGTYCFDYLSIIIISCRRKMWCGVQNWRVREVFCHLPWRIPTCTIYITLVRISRGLPGYHGATTRHLFKPNSVRLIFSV